MEGRECSGCYGRRSAHMPTTRGRQPLEVAHSRIRAIPAPASSQSAAEKHRWRTSLSTNTMERQSWIVWMSREVTTQSMMRGTVRRWTFMCDCGDDPVCIIYVRFWRFALFWLWWLVVTSLQNLCVIVSMMEFARLWRFAVCNIYVRWQFASWRQFFEKSFFLSEFRTDVRTIFLGGTIQEAGAERERERESRMGRTRRPTRTRLMMTVRKNQMVLQRHNQVNVRIWLWWWFPLQCFGRRYLSISIYLSVIFSIYLSGFGYDDVFKSSEVSG